MEIIKIGILIIIVIVLSNGIPTYSKEITALITVSCCTVVLLYISDFIVSSVNYIKNIAEKISFVGFDAVMKAVGVGLITQFVSDMAIDSNNKSLANQMIFAGRISIFVLAMPLFMEVLKIIERLTEFV